MEEEAPMSLVEDHFDDMSIDDRPLDGESFFNEEELEEEEVQPTSENFSAANRYRPSQRTPGQLPTIREEKHDESRSNPGSRPASSNLRMNMSNNSHDISNQFQFQNGVNAIEQYTENFYSKQNEAERLFPEHELLQPGNFASPPFDKQNSWEPSVCHYEKQPTPEVMTDSPKTIFGNLSKIADKTTDKADKVNDENDPTSLRVSPERSIFTTSPLNSTRFLDAKTSTPKRPGASNRFGQRQPPILEYSTIYESPQRISSDKPNTSRLFRATQNQTSSQVPSETMLSNRTINESLVRKVISGSKVDSDLFAALENARKKREMGAPKPDFRPKAIPSRIQPKIPPPLPLLPAPVPAAPAPAPQSSAASEVSRPRHQKPERHVDVSNSTTTNSTNLTRMSTTTGTMAKSMLSSREDLSRVSSRARLSSTSSSTSSSATASTVIPNHPRSDSVNTSRTVSRASSTTSTINNNPQHHGSVRPLKITATRMAFGVVPVNETLTMDLDVENVSDRRCQILAKIDSKTGGFQILDSKMMLIEPGKSTKIRVAFTPPAIGRYQVLLAVEVPAQNSRHKIPIWAFGGTALITPITTANDLHDTANKAEFVMHSANLSRISFKLANTGLREGFALISVLDSSLRPLSPSSTTYHPSSGIVLRRQHEKRIDIRLDTTALDDADGRTSSAMSSVSTTRRRASGADLVIRIAWGEEVLRQRLAMLERQSAHHQLVDSQDFTSFQFNDEPTARPIDKSFPLVVPEDFSLFSSSYRTIYVFVYSSHTAFRQASASRAAADSTESTILETTAFRNQTYVNDATVMPMRGKK